MSYLFVLLFISFLPLEGKLHEGRNVTVLCSVCSVPKAINAWHLVNTQLFVK